MGSAFKTEIKTNLSRNIRDPAPPESVRTKLSDRQQRKYSLSPALHSSQCKVQILRREREGRYWRGSRGVAGESFYMSSLELLWTFCVAYQNHFTSQHHHVVRQGQEHRTSGLTKCSDQCFCSFHLVDRIMDLTVQHKWWWCPQFTAMCHIYSAWESQSYH